MRVHTRSQAQKSKNQKEKLRQKHSSAKKHALRKKVPLKHAPHKDASKKHAPRPIKKICLIFVPKARPAPKAIKRSAELLYEVEKVLDARMGKFGPEYLVKWKGYAASKNQWIDELPPFFKRRCLLLLHRAKWGDSWASSSDESDTDEEEESEEDSDSSDGSSDSDEDEWDECYCTATRGGRRYRQ
jgi:hypothetical protein